jgi:hypothetical protein
MISIGNSQQVVMGLICYGAENGGKEMMKRVLVFLNFQFGLLVVMN